MNNQIAFGDDFPEQFIFSFYKISYKPNLQGKIKYGQHYYDFDEGGLFFVSPNQVSGSSDKNMDHSGFTLFIHLDFFLNYPLAKKIRQYNFFLMLSPKHCICQTWKRKQSFLLLTLLKKS